MFTSDLDQALLTMVVLGMTFPGKNIVGLSYLLEFMMQKHQEAVVNYYMYLEPCLMIVICFSY